MAQVDLNQLMVWIQVGSKLFQIGQQTVDQIRASHDVPADVLAAISEDYDRRLAQAKAEAEGLPVPEA